jgi:hypothetical protein
LEAGAGTDAEVTVPNRCRVLLDRGILCVLHRQAPLTGEAHIVLGIAAAVDERDQVFQYPGIGWADLPVALVTTSLAALKDTGADTGRCWRVVSFAGPEFD